MNRIDHIVIAAESLDQGVEYIRDVLGVEIPKGGVHTTMGTHNHLMQLGDESYLELIAIDPDAKIPAHPRWFALDDDLMREALRKSPRLITWVMNTPNIARLAQDTDFHIGKPTQLQRDNLSWQIALTDDGRLLANGLMPYVIQWHSRPHPSTSMANLGCRLAALEIHHNRPAWIYQNLASIGAEKLVTIHSLDDDSAPYLLVKIDTPAGVKSISSRVTGVTPRSRQ